MTTIKHAGVPVAVVPAGAISWMAFCNKCGFVKTMDGPAPDGLTHDGCNYFAGVYGSVDVTAGPSEPGADLVELIGALWQVLDDMGPDGLSCSPAAKAQAIAALRPWIGSDGADVAPSGMETTDD